jgi:hypothetical protein
MRDTPPLAVVDALVYAVTVSACAFAVATLVGGILLRWSWFGIELVLFFGGWLLLAYGTALSWPDSPWSVDRSEGEVRIDRSETASGRTDFEDADSGLDGLVASVPPLNRLAPADRFAPGPKLLAGSVLTLALSYVVEVVAVGGA